MTSFNVFSISAGESATYFADTNEKTGTWYAIQVLETATFSTLTAINWDGTQTDGLQVGAGQILYGSFTKIQLSSGRVVAYKR